MVDINRLTPNDSYMGHTAPLTSKRCILYIYSTNIGIEYFKHAHNANLFGSCIIHILYTGCAKIKKNNSGAKGLRNKSAVCTVDLKSFVISKPLCRQSEIRFFIQPSAENHPCHNYTCPQNNTHTYPTHPNNCLLILLPKYPFQTPISALLAEDIHAPPPAVQMMIHHTRQAMYVWRNIEACSSNQCCSRKAGSVTYYECVFVALGIQHAMCMRYIVNCGLPRSTTFFRIISQTAQLSKNI